VHSSTAAADFAKQVQQKQMQVPVPPAPAPVSSVNPTPAKTPTADNLLSTLPVQSNAPAAK
jgi:hypothetical protein